MSVRPEHRPQTINELRLLINSADKKFDAKELITHEVVATSFEPKNKIIKFLTILLLITVIGFLVAFAFKFDPFQLIQSKTETVVKKPIVTSSSSKEESKSKADSVSQTSSNSGSRSSTAAISSPSPSPSPATATATATATSQNRNAVDLAIYEYQTAAKSGQLTTAEQILKKAIQFAPNNPKLQFELAQFFVAQKRYQEASAAINKAKSLDPTLSFVSSKERFISVHEEITSFEKKNLYDEQKNSELNSSINAILEEGEQCYSRKKFDCAISSANNALRLKSDNERANSLKIRAQNAQKAALDSITVN
jgi:tetratricopeptide (TPR) repeat protein